MMPGIKAGLDVDRHDTEQKDGAVAPRFIGITERLGEDRPARQREHFSFCGCTLTSTWAAGNRQIHQRPSRLSYSAVTER
jgi:hypothetical protein